MLQRDAVIVGGGPAGSTCAWQLVRAGMDVVIIDRAEFPRDKICAGWITPQVLAELEVGSAEYRVGGRVLEPVTGFSVARMGDSPVVVEFEEPVSYGIRRCELDDFLLRRSGAELRLGESLQSLEHIDGRWCINGELQAPLLIGAGGHFCPVARRLEEDRSSRPPLVTAQEIEVELDAEQLSQTQVEPSVPELFFDRNLAGYGWCFLKGGFLNVGLGLRDTPRLKARVTDFVEDLETRGRIPKDLKAKFKGHAYLLWPDSTRRVFEDGVLLVGDAAGLAYAASGEGIRPAVESGILAAEVVVEARGQYGKERLAHYGQLLSERFGRRRVRSVPWLPASWRSALAGRLMKNEAWCRRVLVERWFLNRRQQPLSSCRRSTWNATTRHGDAWALDRQ